MSNNLQIINLDDTSMIMRNYLKIKTIRRTEDEPKCDDH